MRTVHQLVALVIFCAILSTVPARASDDKDEAARWTPELSMTPAKRHRDRDLRRRLAGRVRREAGRMEGETSDYVSQIWVAKGVDGDGPPRQYTTHETSSTHPRFSPDGSHLAFLSKRGESSPSGDDEATLRSG